MMMSANVSEWRPQAAGFFDAAGAADVVQFAVVCEHRARGTFFLEQMKKRVGRAGWHALTRPAEKTPVSTSGGVMILYRQHLKVQPVTKFPYQSAGRHILAKVCLPALWYGNSVNGCTLRCCL